MTAFGGLRLAPLQGGERMTINKRWAKFPQSTNAMSYYRIISGED